MEHQKPFSERLRAWQGKKVAKEAASLLGVNVRTYNAWIAGWSQPTTALSMREVEQRMRDTDVPGIQTDAG